MNKIKKFIRKLINFLNKSCSIIFYLCPVKKNKVTFCNFAGKGYGCNPKYLAEEFRKDKNYKLVWFVSDLKDKSVPTDIKKVKYGSLKHYYHLITAKLWIDNIRNSVKPLFKRKKQLFVQTWHGGIAVKGIEKDVEEYLPKQYIRKAKQSGKLENYIISGSEYQTELIKRAFWTNAEILNLGIPRDDGLFEIDEERIKLAKRELKIENKKVILYAPTFREEEDFYKNLNFNTAEIIERLNKKFGGEHVVAIRLHPNDATPSNLSYFKNVINFGLISDSHMALHLSDYLISDYSSMIFDFARLGKLSFIYAPDYEEYLKNERKLYFDLKHTEFPFALTFKDLMTEISKVNYNKYKNQLSLFYKKYGFYDNKQSSRKIMEYLKTKIG